MARDSHDLRRRQLEIPQRCRYEASIDSFVMVSLTKPVGKSYYGNIQIRYAYSSYWTLVVFRAHVLLAARWSTLQYLHHSAIDERKDASP